MRPFSLVIVAALSVGALSAAAAPEHDPIGIWNRDDGLGGVRIARCGAALCGHIAWLKSPEGPGRIGQKVLYNMRKTAANAWAGLAHNPEDDGTYSGTMVLSGNQLMTRGCAAGGLLCQSVGLSRAR